MTTLLIARRSTPVAAETPGRMTLRPVSPTARPSLHAPPTTPTRVVDQEDLDPHGLDTISAGLDFDEKGNELIDSTMTNSLMMTRTQTRERPSPNPITVLLVY